MRRSRMPVAGVDPKLLVKDAAKLLPDPSRRLFLRNAASVGGLALLTGCSITDGMSAETALRKISEFNDWVQARLFNPNRLAPTYPESAITRPFRFNALLPGRRGARHRRGPLSADRRRPDREQAALDAWSSSTPCRRRRRSRGSSASRAGAQSANGRARRCASSCAASAPTCAPSTCTSPARRAIRAPSTWPRRCTRRRR